jgi:hypothetical protein
VTVTDTPTQTSEVDEAQLLFHEARERRKRRRLISGIGAVVVVLLVGISVGLLASQGGGSSPRPLAHRSPTPSASAAASAGFSIRPVLCYAPPYAVAPGQGSSTGPLPACSPSSQLTPSNLQVVPASNVVNGYTNSNNIGPDNQFATYPSTTASNNMQNQVVLLPGAPGGGQSRYVLGPVGLNRSAIAHAHVTHPSGQWAIYLTLTPNGSAQWDRLAKQQFHATVGVVINGQVVSAPITQPTQSSFTSFDGQLQISGSFTEHQAKTIASEL